MNRPQTQEARLWGRAVLATSSEGWFALSDILPRPCVRCQSESAQRGFSLCMTCLAMDMADEQPKSVIPWRSVAEVEREEIDWLWYPRIARGKLTLVAGDPGNGKSMFTMGLAAKLTAGFPLPDGGEAVKGTVLLASFEDGAGDTIRPRLELAGADLSRVLLLDQFKDENDKPRSFRGSDVPSLDAALDMQPDACCLVIDPIMAYVGAIDAYRDNEVRSSLQPLVDMAQRRKLAVICVVHLNKSQVENILYKVSGSMAFAALARSVLLVGEDERNKRRGIAHIKSNIGPKADTLEFTIDARGFHWGKVNKEFTAQQMLERVDGRTVNRPKDVVEEWLCDLLKDGPVKADAVKEEAEALGYSLTTVGRVKRKLGIEHHRIGDTSEVKGGGYFVWQLP